MLAVYAYGEGGAGAVGLAGLVRMVPAGLAAPLTGVLVDRHSRCDVVLASVVTRAALMAAMGAAIGASAPFGVVLALATLSTIASTAHRPAQAALLPTLANNPQQLAAANVVCTGVDNATFLVGGLLSGALIAILAKYQVFLVTAALFVVAAFAVARIKRDPVPDYRIPESGVHPVRDAIDGFRQVGADRTLRMIVGVLSALTVAEGFLEVLIVLLAIDLLGVGGSGVGWLNACWGFGGVIGGAGALILLRRGRLAAGLAIGGLLFGVPLIVIGAAPYIEVATTMLVVLGLGYALVEVAGASLLQRMTSNDLLGRAFAVLESSYWFTAGLGAILAPLIVDAIGTRGALIVVGAALPVLVLIRWSALARLEAGAVVPDGAFSALRNLPLFAPLPIATIENLSRRADELLAPAGQAVIREGDHGDSFYVVAGGQLDVSRHDTAFPALVVGDYFGEIALLEDVPRTATVTAREDCRLYALDRESFLFAVSSHPFATQSARSVVSSRLDAHGPRPGDERAPDASGESDPSAPLGLSTET